MREEMEAPETDEPDEPGQIVGDAVYSDEQATADFQNAMADEPEPEQTPEKPEPEQAEEQVAPKPEPMIDPKITELEQQIADLKAENDKFKYLSDRIDKIDTKIPDPVPVDDTPEELKDFYDVYPEMKKAITFEAQKLMRKDATPDNIAETIKQLQEKVIAQENKNQINDYVGKVTRGFSDAKGQWIEGIPDADHFTGQPEFQKYLETTEAQNPGFKATLRDPEVMISTIKKLKGVSAKQKTNAEAYYSDDIPAGNSDSAGRKDNILSLEQRFKKEMKAA